MSLCGRDHCATGKATIVQRSVGFSFTLDPYLLATTHFRQRIWLVQVHSPCCSKMQVPCWQVRPVVVLVGKLLCTWQLWFLPTNSWNFSPHGRSFTIHCLFDHLLFSSWSWSPSLFLSHYLPVPQMHLLYMYVQCLSYCPVVLKNDEGYPRAKCWFDEEQQWKLKRTPCRVVNKPPPADETHHLFRWWFFVKAYSRNLDFE